MTMPSIILLKNPLNPEDCEQFSVKPGTPIIDWLQEYAPEGFGMPVMLTVNQKEVPVADADRRLEEGDVCHVIVSPGALPGWEVYVIMTLISLAISITMNLLFPPPKQKNRNYGPNPVYDIGATRNQQRLGEPIPVLYGAPITVPDFAAAPYTFFSRTGSADMYLDQLLCVGVGEFEEITLDDILIGDTPAINMPPGTLSVMQFQRNPGGPGNVKAHEGKWGRIKNQTWNNAEFNITQEYSFMEHVYTAPEVTDWEFNSDETTANQGYSGQVQFMSNTVAADGRGTIIFPLDWALRAGQVIEVSGTTSNDGTYQIMFAFLDESIPLPDDQFDSYTHGMAVVDSQLQDETAPAARIFTEVKSSNAEAGPYYAQPSDYGVEGIWFDFVAPQGVYRVRSSGRYEYPDVNGGHNPQFRLKAEDLDTGAVVTRIVGFSHNRPEPRRYSFNLSKTPGLDQTGAIEPGHRYKVTVTALHKMTDTQKIQNKVVWQALRSEIYHAPDSDLYGDTTLLAVRMKATNGISSQAQDQFRVRARRKFKLLDGSVSVSTNPADITYDIYTDRYHGAGRRDNEVDRAAFDAAKKLWDTIGTDRPKFSGVFMTSMTVWEGMEKALAMAVARPAIDAGQLTIIAEKKKPFTQFVFNNNNIIADTFSASYTLDVEDETDAIEVEYRDYETFKPAFVSYGDDPSPENPNKVEYLGITDRTYAQKMARFLWNQRIFQRQSVNFDTEMDGMIPRVGDRISVASPIVTWGVSGRVLACTDGVNIQLDHNLDWSVPFIAVKITGSDGLPSKTIRVDRGDEDNQIVLREDLVTEDGTAMTLDLSQTREPPSYMAYSLAGAPKDMIVTQISHGGGTKFTISAINYPIGWTGNHQLFDGAPKHLEHDWEGTPI